MQMCISMMKSAWRMACLLGRNVSYKDIDFQLLFWGRKNKEYAVYESHF